jgi:hypothetical protein
LSNSYNDEFLWYYPYIDPDIHTGNFNPINDALFDTDLWPGQPIVDFEGFKEEGW